MSVTNWKNIFEQAEALRTMPELTSDQARQWVSSELGVTTEEAGRVIYAGLKRQIIFKSPMRTLCGVDSVWRPGTAGMGGVVVPLPGGIGRVCGNSPNIPSFRKKNCSSLS
jgi:hypothetical protein